MGDGSMSGTKHHRVDRPRAEHEYDLYKRHDRPPRPYYGKCLRCEEMWKIGGSLLRAEDAVRRHAGVHGGLKDERAQIVATDARGRELFRVHAIFKPEDEPQGCPECGFRSVDDDRIACPNCGHIPEEDRLVPDGGAVDGGTNQLPNGIYLVGDTPKKFHPLATEGQHDDKLLLIEALQENLSEEEQANLRTHLSDTNHTTEGPTQIHD